jgi:uncharacterized membrane protein
MDTNIVEELVALAISYLVPVVEACGAVVIMFGVLRSLVRYVRSRFRPDLPCLTGMRSQLMPSMVMGLDFQLAADILKTAISPSWEHILQLAALIGLRTALTHVLEHGLHELHAGAEPKHGQSAEHN